MHFLMLKRCPFHVASQWCSPMILFFSPPICPIKKTKNIKKHIYIYIDMYIWDNSKNPHGFTWLHLVSSFYVTAERVKQSPPGKGNTSESPARLGESFQDRNRFRCFFGGRDGKLMCHVSLLIPSWISYQNEAPYFFVGDASMYHFFWQKLIPPPPRFFWRPRNQLRSRSSTSIPLVRSNFLSLSAWRLWESINLGFPNKNHR